MPSKINADFFNVYPNPTKGEFIFELNGKDKNVEAKVEIFSMRGEKVRQEVLYGETKHEFSLSENPPGIYIIRVTTGNQTGTAKIIRN